jgi:co-chaperonin GroES (HSP10)
MDKFNIMPISGTKNRVFVEDTKGKEKKSGGGLILVENEYKEQTDGIVIAVSESDENGLLPKVKVGDHVFFDEHGFSRNEHNGNSYLSMRESSIIGILNKNN